MVKVHVPSKPPAGVPQGALDTVVRLLNDGRRTFGSAGASLTWGIEGSEASDVTAGIEGERMTARILSEWMPNHSAAVVVHSVGWPGSKGDTDHILIIGNHVILIDSKRWMSKRKYSVTASGSIKRGTVDFPEGKVKIMPAINSWREVLGGKIKVSGIVCIAQDEVYVPYDRDWHKAPYRLVTAESLPGFLDERVAAIEKSSPGSTQVIGAGLVSLIVTRAIKPRDRRKELINVHGL